MPTANRGNDVQFVLHQTSNRGGATYLKIQHLAGLFFFFSVLTGALPNSTTQQYKENIYRIVITYVSPK